MKNLFLSIILVVAINFLIGCSTFHQGIDPENSGVMSHIKVEKGIENGSVINAEARDRYNDLIETYGERLYKTDKVRLKKDDGLEARDNNEYNITDEHMHYFKKMNRWGKSDSSKIKMKNSK